MTAGQEVIASTASGTQDEEVIPSTDVVKLTSLDGFTFELPLEACKTSLLCKTLLQTLISEGSDGPPESLEPLEMLRVGKKALEKVVAFLKHNYEEPLAEIPYPFESGTFDEIVTQEWYRDFCSDDNLPRELLAEVLSAANYMDISPLLDLMCLKFTFQLVGKNADEIRELLNLPTMTSEEEQQAREQYPWLFENATTDTTTTTS